MACFVVPAVEAVAVTIAAAVMKKKHKKQTETANNAERSTEKESATPFYKKLGWLASLLWGGVILLAFEHLWHGEIVPWFPFLTAMSDPTAIREMLIEMATVGVTMSVVVTAAWAVVVAIGNRIATRVATGANNK